MAHKWNPKTDPIGLKEPIGRRLFDEPMLMGAQDQPSFRGLDYRHFEETRDDKELSLDRLGCTGIEKKAKNYLYPRADAAGVNRRPPRQFNGWVYVRACILDKGWQSHRFPVIASPIAGDELKQEDNAHHAHIDLGDDIDATTNALYLREIFTRHGDVVKFAPPNAAIPHHVFVKGVVDWVRSGLEKLLNWGMRFQD